MKDISNIELLGDSILQGIQVNESSKRYVKKNEIDTNLLEKKFHLLFRNDSHFGCTVTKGATILDKLFHKGLSVDAIIMDFGGNDCDFDWAKISDNPNEVHTPKTPIDRFLEEYRDLIKNIKDQGIVPILTTLPPLEPHRFYDWWCGKLNKENIMKWLGDVSTIYHYQENYSNQVKKLAEEENVPIVPIREAFLAHGNVPSLICMDGTHPNTNGQKVITEAFHDFFNHFNIRSLSLT